MSISSVTLTVTVTMDAKKDMSGTEPMPLTFLLNPGEKLRIGRAPDQNDIVVNLRSVSNVHADIFLSQHNVHRPDIDGQRLYIRDFSSNGTGILRPGDEKATAVCAHEEDQATNALPLTDGCVLLVPFRMRAAFKGEQAKLSLMFSDNESLKSTEGWMASALKRPSAGGEEPVKKQQALMHPSAKVGLLPSFQNVFPVQLVVFDFDQTLSVIHVFKALSGFLQNYKPWKSMPPVPPPFAKTEIGQMLKLNELNQSEAFVKYGGFVTAAFGGKKRIAELKSFLQELRSKEMELLICTRGLVGTVQKCLQDLEMKQYFTAVYGNVGDTYGKEPFDEQAVATPDMLCLLGAKDLADFTSKDQLVSREMLKRGLKHPSQACLVEDDLMEIQRAINVCRTLAVVPACGLRAKHFADLRSMAQ